MRTGLHQAGPRHMSAPNPCLSKAWVFSVPESRDPVVGSPNPTQRSPKPVPGVRVAPVGVLDLARRSGLHVQGSDTFPWGSRHTVDILEYIVFPGHVVTPEPSTRWDRMLFTTRLEIAMWAPRLHAIVRGIPVSGYRQLPNHCHHNHG
jgi:hypothetical protein